MQKKFVVIGGMYRSGTTLFETIVGSHSRISIPPRDFPFVKFFEDGKNNDQIYSALESMGIWKRYEEEIERKAADGSHRQGNFKDYFAKSPGKVFVDILTDYAVKIQKEIPGVKCPQNEFYFETLKSWLSDFDLKFIHLVRNPFDMVASFQNASYYSENIKNNFDNIGVHSRNWYRSVSLGLARSFFSPRHYYFLKYEDLCEHPSRITRKVCDFLEVDFEEERMLNRHDYAYYSSNTSFEGQPKVADNEFIKPAKSRKNHLAEKEIKAIGRICGELARVVGYEDKDLNPSRPEEFKYAGNGFKGSIRQAGKSLLSVLKRQ